MKLTPKQQAFCEHYIASGNATESAIKAGYSKKTAAITGHENLRKPNIKEYIEKQQKKLSNSNIATAEEIQTFFTNVMRGSIREEVTTIDGVVIGKPNIKDRLKAGELLGKTKMMFTDKVKIEGSIPVMIVGEDNLEE